MGIIKRLGRNPCLKDKRWLKNNKPLFTFVGIKHTVDKCLWGQWVYATWSVVDVTSLNMNWHHHTQQCAPPPDQMRWLLTYAPEARVCVSTQSSAVCTYSSKHLWHTMSRVQRLNFI